MTRKDFEKLAQVLRKFKMNDEAYPEAPSAEWFRRRVIREFSFVFKLKKEQEDMFYKAAGMPVTEERTFK